MKRIVLIILCVLMVLAPLSPAVAQDEQWIYAVLIYNASDDAQEEFVWNVSVLYEDFDREGFQQQIDFLEENGGGSVDYLAVFGLNGFEMVGFQNSLSFTSYVFKKRI